MRFQRKVSRNLVVEAEAENEQKLFEAIASVEEVFAERECGRCGCQDLQFRVRSRSNNKFYERVCLNPKCRAVLSFGVHRAGGTLFPRRKDEADAKLPNNGWVKWEGDPRRGSAAPTNPSAATSEPF
jgi:hypothetical protein